MQVPLVMTMIGRDRPGLVELVARLVAENGGNWLESRMSHLGGQFAGILRITVPVANEGKLSAALEGLKGEGLAVVVQRDEATASTAIGEWAELSLVGQDRPGIVRQISEAFARHGINVEDLATECSSAPMSGERLFHARAKVQIPPDCPLAEFRKDLEKIAADFMVDVQFNQLAEASR